MEAHRRNGTRLTATRVPKANSNARTQLTARFVSCKVWHRALLVLIVAGFTILAEAQTVGSQSIGSSPACPSKTRPIYQFPFLRYDEDWSFLSCSQQTDRWDRIKYLPVGKNGSYLSLGGDVRGVYESYDNQYWGQGPQNQSGWVVHHYLFHGDLHLNSSIRLYGELQSAFENGRNGGPRPYDENKLDIHQAFFDVRCCRSTLSLTARIGRQELYYGSGRLVDARFGLNTRISFDGVKLIVPTQHSKIEIFATRPTLQRPGIFDDPPDSKTLFWGVYSTRPVHESASLDVYYLGYKAASQTFAVGTGSFQSNTFGGRLAGRQKRYDYDTEINAQVGTFQAGNVRAWSASSMNGFTTTKKAWSPRVGLRSDITSGDNNPSDRHLGTFFPLYARGKYFGEADLNGPVNTVDVLPALDLHPRQDVLVSLSYGSFWRESIRDGLYGFAGNLYKPANQTDARFIGQQAEVDINYSVAPHMLLRVVYQQFFAGEYLRETPPGKDVNYATAWLDYHF